jgi:hypothetical protein
MAYNSGSGNVPAIGTLVTQGGVSGYLLGVWASWTVAPTAAASAMPTSGFLKFREVTGGSFSAGALTGIGASAVSADVQGWIEVVHDQAASITVPRLGSHIVRGGRFYLGNTTGTLGQTFQVPTNGAGGYPCGAWIEKTPGSANTDADYHWWPGLNGATNGWAQQHIGEAVGQTDIRQAALKTSATGLLTMGEAYTQTGTYASLAAQASTYATIAHSGTYTWVGGIVTVDLGTTAHLLETGWQTGLDFTSGAATDGIFTITVTGPYTFTVELAGSGTGGNVTSRPGIRITFATSTVNVNNEVYCDFTSGSGVDGIYTCYGVNAATSYDVIHPHTAALTGGAVSVLHTIILTAGAVHGLNAGQRFTLDFTTGAGVDGVYVAETIPSTTTIRIRTPHAVAVSGNYTMSRTIGHIAPSGCRVWIPSTILRECTTGARGLNAAPSTSLTARPDWVTTSAGAIDFEYLYGESGWLSFTQPYSFKLKWSCFMDSASVAECPTAVEAGMVGAGMYIAGDVVSLQTLLCFAGGNFDRVFVSRGNTPNTSDHNFVLSYCKGFNIANSQFGIQQYSRNSGYAIHLDQSSDIEITDCTTINSMINSATAKRVNIRRLNHCNRYNGYANATAAQYAVYITVSSDNITVDDVSWGYNNTIPNQHPYAIAYYSGSTNIKVRNCGAYDNPLNSGSFAPNLYCMYGLTRTYGGNIGVKLQRIYINNTLLYAWSELNADKDLLFEHVSGGMYLHAASRQLGPVAASSLDSQYKNVQMVNSINGQASVYGTHFHHHFIGSNFGRWLISFNEPTAATASQFTMVSGTAKFNSSGGLVMPTIGNQCIWEDPIFRIGTTGFVNTVPVMSGGTIANYLLEYQIDLGSGFSEWATLNGTNLSAHVVDPAIGYKLKVRITTTTTNTTAITYLRISTTTTAAAQSENLYPLDTASVQINGLVPNSRVKAAKASDGTVLFNGATTGTTIDFQTEYIGAVLIEARKASAAPYYIPWVTQVTTVSGATVYATALQQLD